MRIKICKIDEAEGIILPREYMDRLNLVVGDELQLTVSETGFSLTPNDTTFQRQLDAGSAGMEKYKIALAKLAKSYASDGRLGLNSVQSALIVSKPSPLTP